MGAQIVDFGSPPVLIIILAITQALCVLEQVLHSLHGRLACKPYLI